MACRLKTCKYRHLTDCHVLRLLQALPHTLDKQQKGARVALGFCCCGRSIFLERRSLKISNWHSSSCMWEQRGKTALSTTPGVGNCCRSAVLRVAQSRLGQAIASCTHSAVHQYTCASLWCMSYSVTDVAHASYQKYSRFIVSHVRVSKRL